MKTYDRSLQCLKISNTTVCSGLDNSCVQNSNYVNGTVTYNNLSHFNIVMNLKFYILENTPFDMIIGLLAIRENSLASKYPSYFGLNHCDVTSAYAK
jgi:hypothetical protein